MTTDLAGINCERGGNYGDRRPMAVPMGVAQQPMIELFDDFKTPVLKATWGAWKEPDMSCFKTGDGVLVVQAKGNSYSESSPLTIRARNESYEVQVIAKIEGACAAALGLEYNPKVAVRVELKTGQLDVHGPKEKLSTRKWSAGNAWLRLVNRKNRVEILASEDGQKWQSLLADFDVSDFNHNGQHAASKLRVRRWRQAERAPRVSPAFVTGHYSFQQ